MSADWNKIWRVNSFFWSVGFLFSGVLIFCSGALASLLVRVSGSEEGAEISLGGDREQIVQLFGCLLLVRQSHYMVIHIGNYFPFTPFLKTNVLLTIYFALTLGFAVLLIRRPEFLNKERHKVSD